VSPAVTITVNPIVYTAPVAVAGSAQSVSAPSLVMLNGQSSYDTNAPALPLSYAWTLLTKPLTSAAVLANASSAIATFTADIPGTYQAMLTVSNGRLSSTSTVLVTAGGTIPVVKVMAYASSSFALKADGSLWAWGYNSYGQLGNSSQVNMAEPTKVGGSGYIWAAPGMYGITAGKADGSVWAWGRNAAGSFGNGSSISTDVIISSPTRTQTDAFYASAASGNFYTVAVKPDGTLMAWGENAHGGLGDGTAINKYVPKQVGSGFKAVAVGAYHTLGLKTDGTLWAWGYGNDGEIGDGFNQNRYVPTLVGSGYVDIAAGFYHSVALKADGSLWLWGSPGGGAMGPGVTQNVLTPQYFGGGYKSISASHSKTFAIKTDGSLWAWGMGPLGDGTTLNSAVPKLIGTGFAMVAPGIEHAIALKTDGSLWAWGLNGLGQLGDGFKGIDSLTPKRIAMP
jgi:alpha-tubulin suppressor-like RCC1 family protein